MIFGGYRLSSSRRSHYEYTYNFYRWNLGQTDYHGISAVYRTRNRVWTVIRWNVFIIRVWYYVIISIIYCITYGFLFFCFLNHRTLTGPSLGCVKVRQKPTIYPYPCTRIYVHTRVGDACVIGVMLLVVVVVVVVVAHRVGNRRWVRGWWFSRPLAS